jgi:hypothetical protein
VSDPAASRPTAGARFRLVLAGVDGARARYDAAILTPDAEHAYALELEAGAEPVVRAVAAPAPASLEAALTMIAKLTARGAIKRAEDGLSPWPPQLLRWRGPGRGQ